MFVRFHTQAEKVKNEQKKKEVRSFCVARIRSVLTLFALANDDEQGQSKRLVIVFVKVWPIILVRVSFAFRSASITTKLSTSRIERSTTLFTIYPLSFTQIERNVAIVGASEQKTIINKNVRGRENC